MACNYCRLCFIEYLKEADRLPLCEQKKTIKNTLFVTIHFEDKKIEIQIRSALSQMSGVFPR